MHLRVHRLDHHDRIVDHDANCQHQREERDQVDRQSHKLHEEKRTDQGNGHGNRRNERGTHVAQEQEHHQRHEHERLEERVKHLLDRGLEERRDVITDLEGHARRE